MRNLTQTASQRTRRTSVRASFIGYPLVVIGYLRLVAPGRIPTPVWAPVSVFLIGLTIVGSLAIYGNARDRADLAAKHLDERQQRLRDRAWVLSYAVLSTLIGVIVGGAALYSSFVGPITIAMADLGPWLVAFALDLTILPSAALAWIEPDPPLDEVTDERALTR